MGIAEILGIVISLVTTLGPKAMEVWAEWMKEVGPEPTEVDWIELRNKIASHNPDTY